MQWPVRGPVTVPVAVPAGGLSLPPLHIRPDLDNQVLFFVLIIHRGAITESQNVYLHACVDYRLDDNVTT
jgi:hypothetical protein